MTIIGSEGGQDPGGSSLLRKSDESLRQRIELLQDFGFPGSSSDLAFSGDGRFIVAAGSYPPACRVYELEQLGMKYERRLSCECLEVEPLTADLGKMVFLLADRTLDFHAPYGTHYKTRVPSHGRGLTYDAARCEVLVAATKGFVYRLDLDEGKFLKPFSDATSGGLVRFWDARCDSRRPCARLVVEEDESATCVAFDSDGLGVAVGTSGGTVKLFDVRSANPVQTKEHQHGLPIVDVHFHARSKTERHAAAKLMLSADARLVKAWDARTGAVAANVEPSGAVARLRVAPVGDGSSTDSGLILCTGEQPRVMAYYAPALGPAPRWCHFLDSITEELEETSRGTAYDDYRFITQKELEDLGASGLVGTPMLRAYMHGFFIDARLHKRLKAVAEPFAYDAWRKQKVAAKLAEKAASRIRNVASAKNPNNLPKVNAKLAGRLIDERATGDVDDDVDESGDERDEGAKQKRTKLDAKKRAKRRELDDGLAVTAANPLGDDRFKAMFENTDFQVDERDQDYILRHPRATARPPDSANNGGDGDGDNDDDDAPPPHPKRPPKKNRQQTGDAKRNYSYNPAGGNKPKPGAPPGKATTHRRVRTTPSTSLGLGGAVIIENDGPDKPLSKRLKKKQRN